MYGEMLPGVKDNIQHIVAQYFCLTTLGVRYILAVNVPTIYKTIQQYRKFGMFSTYIPLYGMLTLQLYWKEAFLFNGAGV